MGFKIGEKLSEEVSDYVDIWANKTEFREIAEKHDKSTELIRGILRRDRKFTESNIPLIKDVLIQAKENRDRMVKELNATHRKVLKLIKD